LPPLPKEPAAIFAAAAPLYDFSSATLKPFHLKASYQLYDEKGQPSAQGTYEYWWASQETYRSTWSRPGMEHTDWHVDGKHYLRSTGAGIEFFEEKLQSDLLDPLPDSGTLEGGKVEFQREEQKFGSVKLPCVMVAHKLPLHPGHFEVIPMGMFPTYCFDPASPTLRAYYAFGAISVVYNRMARFQNRILPQELGVLDRGKKILTAKIENVSGLTSATSVMTPPEDAKLQTNQPRVEVSKLVANGNLLTKTPPIYPQEAKDAHLQGKVVLKALIGSDGRVHDLSVVEGPATSLIAAAMQAVLQWRYKPYELNGEPVEVDTEITVIFQLG
jgi:TonB family protein